MRAVFQNINFVSFGKVDGIAVENIVTDELIESFFNFFFGKPVTSKKALLAELMKDAYFKDFFADNPSRQEYLKYFLAGKCDFFECSEVGETEQGVPMINYVRKNILNSDNTGDLENVVLFEADYKTEPIVGDSFDEPRQDLIYRKEFKGNKFFGVAKTPGVNQSVQLVQALKDKRSYNVSLNAHFYKADGTLFQNNYIETIQFIFDKSDDKYEVVIVMNDMHENLLLLDYDEQEKLLKMKSIEKCLYVKLFQKFIKEVELATKQENLFKTIYLLHYENN